MESLEKVFSVNIERAERASTLHNDVTHFWVQHLSSFKQIIAKKNEEIRDKNTKVAKLQQELETKKTKAKNIAKDEEDKQQQQKQYEQALKTIESQKMQINELKSQLKQSEQQRAAIPLERVNSIPSFVKEEQFKKEAEANNKMLELEAKNNSLVERINQLDKDLRKSRLEVEEKQGNINLVQKQLDDANTRLKEADANLNKYMNLLEIERSKQTDAPTKSPEMIEKERKIAEAEREQFLIEIMKLNNEIKELKENHKKQLNAQSDMLSQRFLREKESLLRSIENKTDAKNLLQAIIDEYEKKLAEGKEQHEKELEETLRIWSGKLSVQQRQYQNRIKQMNQQHEIDLIDAQKSVQYQTAKLKVELESEQQTKLLEETRKFEQTNKDLQIENNKLRNHIANQDTEIQNLRVQLGVVPEEDETQKPPDLPLQYARLDPTEQRKIAEQYNAKIDAVKEELTTQSDWLLKQQKDFYERQIQELTDKHQAKTRELLLKMQDSIARVQKEGENRITLAETMESIHDTVTNLNEQVEESSKEKEEMISLREANQRMKLLTDTIAKLKGEREELLAQNGVNSTMEELEALRSRVKFYESLSQGDKANQVKAMKEMEDGLRQEIALKDALIAHYKEEKEMRATFLGDFYTEEIYSQEPKEEEEEITKPEQMSELKEEAPPVREEPKAAEEKKPVTLQLEQTQVIIHYEKKIENSPMLVRKDGMEDDNGPKVSERFFSRIPSKLSIEHCNEPITVVQTINNHVPEPAPKQSLLIEEQEEPFIPMEKPVELKKTENVLLMRSSPHFIVNEVVPETAKTIERSASFENFTIDSAKSQESNATGNATEDLQRVILEMDENQNFHRIQKNSATSSQRNSQRSLPDAKAEEKTEPPKERKVEIREFRPTKLGNIKPEFRQSTSTINGIPKVIKVSEIQHIPQPEPPKEAEPEPPKEKEPIKEPEPKRIPPVITISPPVSLERQVFMLIDQTLRYSINSFDVFSYESKIEDNWQRPNIMYIKDPVFTESNDSSAKQSQDPIPITTTAKPQVSKQGSFRSTKSDRQKLFLSDANYFGVMQRIVTMHQTAAPIIIRYKGERDMVHFPDFYIEGNPVHLQIAETYVLNDLYDILLNDNIENAQIDPALEQERKHFLNEISNRDITIQRQDIQLADLNSQLKKLQAAYRIAQQSENQIQLLREKNNSMEQLLMQSQERLKLAASPVKSKSQDNLLDIQEDPLEAKSRDLVSTDKRSKKIVVDTSVIEEIDDPFTKAIQLMAALMRFINEFKKNELDVSSRIRNDSLAFESFLIATGSLSDSQSSYIAQMKESTNTLESTIDQLDDFTGLQHQLLAVLRQSKKKAQSLIDSSIEAAKTQLAQEIERQQKELQSTFEVGQAKADKLVLLGRIRTALETVTTLGLNLREEDKETYSRLLQRTNFIELQIKGDKEIPDEAKQIDSLKVDVQNLIAGLKPQQDDSNKYINTQNIKENSDLRKKLKQRDDKIKELNQELESQQTKYAQLMQQCSQLKDRLQEEKESNVSTVSTYQAQISTLKDLLQHTDTKIGTPIDTVSAVKSEIISLHTLVEAIRLERDMKQSTIDEMQEQIREQNDAIEQEKEKLEKVMQSKEELEKLVRKQDEQALFHESDMQKLKLERAQNEQVGIKNRLQLEESLGVIDQLNKEIAGLQKELSDSKKELKDTKNELEDLQIKYSFGHYNRTKIPHTMVGTQTTFRLVHKHRRQPPEQKDEKKESQNTTEEKTEAKIEENKETKNLETAENIDEKSEKAQPVHMTTPRDTESPTESKADIKQPNTEDEYSEDDPGRIPLSKDDTSSSLFHSYDQWVDMSNDEEKDQFAAELEVPTQADHLDIKDFGNQAVGEVHAPLETKKSKPKIGKLLVEPKKGRTQKRPTTTMAKARPIATPDTSKLTIGDFSNNQQPVQQKTINQRYRPVSRKLTQPPMKQKPPKLEPIQVSFKLTPDHQLAQTTPTSPKQQSQSLLMSTSKLRPNGTLPLQPATVASSPLNRSSSHVTPDSSLIDDGETVRITRIQYEQAQTQQNSPRLPIVMPIHREVYSEKKPQNEQVGDLSEIEMIIAKLREKNARQADEIEQKDQAITELNQRVSALMRDLQRAKLDAIRNEDITKKTSIKYDNIKARLDIAMQELDERNDETAKLRREIDKLKRAAEPAAQTLSRLKNAQQEQQRITTEQIRKKQIIDKAKSAIERSKDEKVNKHIEEIMKNTQKSLSRLEATKRMWKEIENRQLIGALAAMSHIDDSQNTLLFNSKLPIVRARVLKSKPQKAKSADDEIPKPVEETPQKIVNPITYDQTLEAISELGSEITSDERRNALRGNVSERIAQYIRKKNEKAPNLDNAVLTGNTPALM